MPEVFRNPEDTNQCCRKYIRHDEANNSDARKAVNLRIHFQAKENNWVF